MYTTPHDENGDDDVMSWSLVIVYVDISSNKIQSDAQQKILTGAVFAILAIFPLCDNEIEQQQALLGLASLSGQ